MSEIILTDENFEEEIKKANKLILVDFWATWCSPCLVLSPILEKLAQDYEDKISLAKVNVDETPQTAQKFGINQIPTVVLFKDGKPVSGFIGARPEPIVKEWLDGVLEKEGLKGVRKESDGTEEGNKEEGGREEGSKEEEGNKREGESEEKEKRGEIEEIIKQYEVYAKKNGFRLNPDKAAVEGLIKGLLANEKKYGARYCPCRRVTGDIEDDRPKICPCVWHKQEIQKDGRCYCGLFAK